MRRVYSLLALAVSGVCVPAMAGFTFPTDTATFSSGTAAPSSLYGEMKRNQPGQTSDDFTRFWFQATNMSAGTYTFSFDVLYSEALPSPAIKFADSQITSDMSSLSAGTWYHVTIANVTWASGGDNNNFYMDSQEWRGIKPAMTMGIDNISLKDGTGNQHLRIDSDGNPGVVTFEGQFQNYDKLSFYQGMNMNDGMRGKVEGANMWTNGDDTSSTQTVWQVAAVPEPTTLGLLGLGALSLVRRRTR